MNFLDGQDERIKEYYKVIEPDFPEWLVEYINTPELLPTPKPYSVEAKEYFTSILENAKEIYLQSDINSTLRDTTEGRRLLAWVWVDNELVNYNLVRLGYANVEYVANEKLRYLKIL